MFFLLPIKESVVLTPEELKDEQLHICRKLEALFLFKFVPKEGLCVLVLDYKVLDSEVFHTEGDVQIQVASLRSRGPTGPK